MGISNIIELIFEMLVNKVNIPLDNFHLGIMDITLWVRKLVFFRAFSFSWKLLVLKLVVLSTYVS
jgi:hypothetical protein